MSPAGEALDDDYVIGLLKKDAESSQKRYLANGLGSLLSKRPRGNAPKPNTRFLKNIIRDTDSHNAALKAKEEEESRARLRELRRTTSKKRARAEDVEDEEGSSKRRKGGDKPGRWASALGGLRGESGKRRSEEHSKEGRRHDPSRRRQSRDTNGHEEERGHKNEHKRSKREPKDRSSSRRQERRRRSSSASTQPTRPKEQAKTDEDTSESDPLENILGPRPAAQSHARGRGAMKSSNIDSRFDPSYNPKEDVAVEANEDRDDWDMALEALRDRVKWRNQGAERLRAAGFTDEEVSKWEKGGEKDVEDVKWRKKGEGREWDRGKVVDESGDVDVKAAWGRLKGT